MENRRLGRGLEALFGSNGEGATAEGATAMLETGEAPLSQIELNPYQPRKSFDEDELAHLTASVKTHGILQPLVVRRVGEQFQLIAGERRLRAAQQVGLAKVPVRVVDLNDQEVLEAALVENIQRADLNAIEKALGFKQHLDQFGLNHDQLAARLGLPRSTVSNLLGFLELSQEVQDGLRNNQITEAHAKLLKGIKGRDKQVSMFKQVVAMGLSVKATEALVREQREPVPTPAAPSKGASGSAEPADKTAHVKSIETELMQKLATPVQVSLRGKDKGSIMIRFESNDDFERILEVLRR